MLPPQADMAFEAADASGDTAQRVDAMVHRGLAVLRTDGAHAATLELRGAVELCESFWELRGSKGENDQRATRAEDAWRMEAAEAAARSNLARARMHPIALNCTMVVLHSAPCLGYHCFTNTPMTCVLACQWWA
jgi:hypothetical protein